MFLLFTTVLTFFFLNPVKGRHLKKMGNLARTKIK